MARRRKPRKPKQFTDLEHHELLASYTRIIRAWEKHYPNKKFGGVSLEEFKKGVQPSFDIDAEIAQLKWRMAQLRKQLGEEDPDAPPQH